MPGGKKVGDLARDKVKGVLDACAREGIPFRMFEGYRSPHRQQYLYEQGRTRPGGIVTHAGPWSSIHQYGPFIVTACDRFHFSRALIVMTIATETAFARKADFTGPLTFRWEPHVEVKDVNPPRMGDYSAGPMQVLATTARWIVRVQGLDYEPFMVAPALEYRIDEPDRLPLYEPDISVMIGTAAIARRRGRTGDDPILVSAAYNAGGVYKSSKNPWRLRTYGDHLDRAAKWYGDACAVLKENA